MSRKIFEFINKFENGNEVYCLQYTYSEWEKALSNNST